jgi:hypothetical protein
MRHALRRGPAEPGEPRVRWLGLGLVLVLAALALVGAPAMPLAIPLLSPGALAAWQSRLGVAPPRLERMEYGALSQYFADQLGWEERVRAVAVAWKALPEAERRRAVLYRTNSLHLRRLPTRAPTWPRSRRAPGPAPRRP